MKQLEFPAVSEGRLREALDWVIEHECDSAEKITLERDYVFRRSWCLEHFGDCMLAELEGKGGYDKIRQVWEKESERGLKNVTIKKRISFLLRALNAAAERELMDPGRVPKMPKKRNDGTPQADMYYTLGEYRRLRSHMPSSWHRAGVDVAFWTGMHTSNVFSMLWRHVAFDHEFRDGLGELIGTGGWYMCNTKNKIAHWLPIDPEFEDCLREYKQEVRHRVVDLPIIGRMHKAAQWLYPAADRARVQRLPLKQFRQSRVKYLESQGYDVGLVRYQLGHKGESRQLALTHYYGTSPGPGATKLMLERLGPQRVEAAYDDDSEAVG